MQHPDIKQLDQAKRIKVHARVRPTQLNYSWFGEYPMILSRQSLGLLPIRARCDCRSQLSRPWTFWYSIYSYLYVYFFSGRFSDGSYDAVKCQRHLLLGKSEIQILDHLLGDGKKAMANCSSHWGAGPWRDFPSNWVVDVDGDSSFDWGKTLGPSKPVFLGIKFSLPWSLGSIILCSYLMAWAFSQFPPCSAPSIVSRAKGASPGDQTLHPGVHEKFFPPVAGQASRKVHQKSTNNDLWVRSD